MRPIERQGCGWNRSRCGDWSGPPLGSRRATWNSPRRWVGHPKALNRLVRSIRSNSKTFFDRFLRAARCFSGHRVDPTVPKHLIISFHPNKFTASIARPSSAIVAYAHTKMHGSTSSSRSRSIPLMDLSHYDPHDKSTGTVAPSSHWQRRGRLTAWVLPLALVAAVALLLDVFGAQDILLGATRTGGLWTAGGTRSAVLLPRGVAKQVMYDCGALESGGGCAASGLLVLQTSDGRGGYARMLDATQDVQLAYAQQWGFSYLRWGKSRRGL